MKNNFIIKLLIAFFKPGILSTIAIVLFLPFTGYTQGCDCQKYLYVNDIDLDGVHKFLVDESTGALTEITNNGALWTTGIINPHGAVFDLNGFMYIAQKDGSTNSNLQKLTCDGQVVDVLFQGNFDGREFNNFVTIDNYLYVNGASNHDIKLYDLCSEVLVGRLDYENGVNNWELMLGSDGNMYTIDRENDNLVIFQVPTDPALYTLPASTTISPFLVTNLTLSGRYWGLEQDENGFWYVINDVGNDDIYVIDPSGNLVNTIAEPSGSAGWGGGRGFEYCADNGKLYVAAEIEDCVAVIDVATGTYEAALSIPGGGGKDLSLVVECCPNPATQTVDESVCLQDGDTDPLFLNNIYPCDGPICEGFWIPADAASTAIFSECDQSISPVEEDCYSFTKSSDGLSALSQCGAFNITLNVCIESVPTAPVISITDNTCNPAVAGSINVDTPCNGGTLEWSTDAGTTWSATAPTYSDTPVTVRARCINNCGNVETADVTSVPQECCPPVNCVNQFGEFTIIKNEP